MSYTAGFNFVDNPSSGAQQQQQNGSIYDDAATAAEDSRKITVVPSATAPTAMDSDHPFGLVDGSSSFIVYSFDISIDSEVVHTIKGRFSGESFSRFSPSHLPLILSQISSRFIA